MSEGRTLSARKDIRGRTPEVGDFIVLGMRVSSTAWLAVRKVHHITEDGAVIVVRDETAAPRKISAEFLILPMEYGDVWGKTS